MKLEGRVAIVTGGGGGLGGATARAFAKEGAHVVVTDLSASSAQAVADEIGGSFYRHDVADEQAWQQIVDEVIAERGRIDVLVNAAGIEGDLSASGLDTSLAEWRRVLAVNLDGTFLGCRIVMPHMIARGTGSIVNISSIVSYMSSSTGLAYGASKAAVQQLTRSIAWIGAQNGAKVRCNSIHPGVIKTRMTDDIITQFSQTAGISEQECETLICAAIPMGVRGMPADIAAMALFLASDDSPYVTGSDMKVDGGWLMTNAG